MNFEVSWLFAKAFSAKFEGMASFCGISEQSAKVFFVKILCSTTLQKFSTYTVYLETCMGGVGYANKTTPPLEAAEACLDME